LGGGGDQSCSRNGVPFFLKFRDGEGVLRLVQDHQQLPHGLLKLLLGFNCGERQWKLVRDSGG
jgi:hypothetical protein